MEHGHAGGNLPASLRRRCERRRKRRPRLRPRGLCRSPYRLARRPNPAFHRALAICRLQPRRTPSDSEQFRSAPRTCHGVGGRLRMRRTDCDGGEALVSGIRRRDFVILLGCGTVAAWPLAARAQQTDRMQRIGVLMGYAESNVEGQAFVAAFREGLLKLGWAEGRNLRSDYRWAPPGDADTTRRFAKELVALQPNLILTHNTATTAAALEQTQTIPIVFAIVADPVGSGFVTNFSRPGGNATGFTAYEPTMV